MRISLTWLRELVPFAVAPDDLAEALTLAGFEVEDIEDRSTWAKGVVVGKVLSRETHPNADRLSVCQVEVGQEEPLSIVCGAKNVAAGQSVAVATLGSYLPKVDLKIKRNKLRGVFSEGMICSLSELGLAKESEGIHVFPEEANLKPGQDVRPLLDLEEVILDLVSTANRADALSMVGIAREVAALTGGQVTLPGAATVQRYPQPKDLTLNIRDPKACPAYVATQIEGVTIAPSPPWLQKRLELAGVRPISNVVDITNWVLLEWGQPLHAFDADRLREGSPSLEIGVRPARADERLTTLDGQTRALSPQALVIVGNDVPIALAGVMGGQASEVHAGTTTLLLEAALFDSAVVRRSARSVGLRSEASTRYERGTNQVEFDWAYQRAIDLILELAGGQVTGQAIADARPDPASFSHRISLRFDRVCQILGPLAPPEASLAELAEQQRDKNRDKTTAAGHDKTAEPEPAVELVDYLSASEVERTLTALGCAVTVVEAGGEDELGRTWEVVVPPYRYRDLEREIDLIEEVARHVGYNRFGSTLPPKTEFGFLPPELTLLRRISQSLRGLGLNELMHYSLRKPEGGRQIVLNNPLLAEYSALRTDLLSGLIEAYEYNQAQGNGPLWGFEVGRIFWTEEDGLFESDLLGGIFGGDPERGTWPRGGKAAPLTWYEAKGVLEAFFDQLNLSVEFQADRANDRLHPGRTASLWLAGERLGTFGQLHPTVCQARDLPDAVYAFELDLEAIYKTAIDQAPPQAVFVPYPAYPSSSRDLAFFARSPLTVSELSRTMQRAGKPLLESVELFDDYRGPEVPEGQRSLAFRLTYRSSDRTLTEADIEPLHQSVRKSLQERFGVNLRS